MAWENYRATVLEYIKLLQEKKNNVAGGSNVTTASQTITPSVLWRWDWYLLGKLPVDSQQSLSFHISRAALENWREFHLVKRKTSGETFRLLWTSICPVPISLYWEDRLKSRTEQVRDAPCTNHPLSGAERSGDWSCWEATQPKF